MGSVIPFRRPSPPTVTGHDYELAAYPGAVFMRVADEESWWTPGDARAFTSLLDLIPHSRARDMASDLWQMADTAEQLETERG